MSNMKIQGTTRHVVRLLVQGEHEQMEKLSKGIRLTAQEIAEGVDDYGEPLAMPPDDAFSNLDVIEVEKAQPRRWSVNIDLWTANDGRSDLTLELTLIENGKEFYDVEIDGIHVL